MVDNNQLDPRARRTREALRQAVLKLIEQRDFSELSVQDITQQAGVNRATFYLHYRDRDDLVGQIFDAIFDEYTAEDRDFLDRNGELAAEIVPPPLVAHFWHVLEHPQLYRRLFSLDGKTAFAARLIAFYESQFQRAWDAGGFVTGSGLPDPTLRATYAAYASFGVVRWWLDHDMQPSPEIMGSHLWTLVRPLWFDTSGLRDSTSSARTSEEHPLKNSP